LHHGCRRSLRAGRLGVVIAAGRIWRGAGLRPARGPNVKGHAMKWLTILVIAIAIAASVLAVLLYAAGGS
jgi:hypothetical protein